MQITEVRDILEAEVLCCDELLTNEVHNAFSSDLMSDVLAYVNGKTLLLTGLINNQVIRTVEMADLNAIVFVRGKLPDTTIIEMAREGNIVLLTTRDTLYTASGKLYSRGLRGVNI